MRLRHKTCLGSKRTFLLSGPVLHVLQLQFLPPTGIAHSKICVDIFFWDDQMKICERIIKILKPEKGSVVFGRQMGNVKGHEIETQRERGLKPGYIKLIAWDECGIT